MANDYSTLGLDKSLRKIGSLGARPVNDPSITPPIPGRRAVEYKPEYNSLEFDTSMAVRTKVIQASIIRTNGTLTVDGGGVLLVRDSTGGTSLIYNASTGALEINGPVVLNGTTNIPNQGTIGTANITLGTAANWNVTGTSVLSGSVTMGTNLAMGSANITEMRNIGGVSGTFYFMNAGRLEVDNHLDPNGAGNLNFGGADRYWLELNFKTLTDRGCLAWCDDGIELQDGRIVSDIEALQTIKKDPVKKTIYGMPMLDYSTLPKVTYNPATDHQGNLFPRDEKGEPYTLDEDGTKREVADGAELTSLISIMLGAIKEIDKRLVKAGI